MREYLIPTRSMTWRVLNLINIKDIIIFLLNFKLKVSSFIISAIMPLFFCKAHGFYLEFPTFLETVKIIISMIIEEGRNKYKDSGKR
jgi:hypothetical protein